MLIELDRHLRPKQFLILISNEMFYYGYSDWFFVFIIWLNFYTIFNTDLFFCTFILTFFVPLNIVYTLKEHAFYFLRHIAFFICKILNLLNQLLL